MGATIIGFCHPGDYSPKDLIAEVSEYIDSVQELVVIGCDYDGDLRVGYSNRISTPTLIGYLMMVINELQGNNHQRLDDIP